MYQQYWTCFWRGGSKLCHLFSVLQGSFIYCNVVRSVGNLSFNYLLYSVRLAQKISANWEYLSLEKVSCLRYNEFVWKIEFIYVLI